MQSNMPNDVVLAEETHSQPLWALAILPAMIAPLLSVLFYSRPPARVALIASEAIGIGVLAMIWAGFQYRFLPQGVEIRMLGIRLRTIPKGAIVSYSIEPWTIARGYGIRGIGRTRAYVWGNQVVHIRTTEGEVYLGHKQPERIVRDLDMVTGFATPS
jgi:hypothetical protein